MLNERMHVVCYTLVRQYCLKKKNLKLLKMQKFLLLKL